MTLDVRKTTPFTSGEDEQIRAFSQPDSWEHKALERVSPVPLRAGSEGAVVRALALIGMAYVRERAGLADDLASGYEELARDRISEGTSESARAAGLRATMARRAADEAAPRGR